MSRRHTPDAHDSVGPEYKMDCAQRRGRPRLLSDYVMCMVHKHAWPISEKGAHGRVIMM